MIKKIIPMVFAALLFVAIQPGQVFADSAESSASLTFTKNGDGGETEKPGGGGGGGGTVIVPPETKPDKPEQETQKPTKPESGKQDKNPEIQKNKAQKTLPQTGEAVSTNIAVLGLALVAMSILVYLFGTREGSRKKNEK